MACGVSETTREEVAVVLGKRYGSLMSEACRRSLSKTLWFTYRSGFAAMEPAGLTDDAGWGCMLRSCQMLMAAVLRRHLGDGRRHEIIKWFNDEPGDKCAYSIHNMVRCGLRYDMLPGEWYGPGVAAHVLRDLCEMHDTLTLGRALAVVVTSAERPLCEEDVLLAATADGDESGAAALEDTDADGSGDDETAADDQKDEYDPLWRPPPWARRKAEKAAAAKKKLEARLRGPWTRRVLVLVPLRLGLHKLEDKYASAILECLSFPQSVGLVGGRPRQALYFPGALPADKQLLGLDPHSVQPATRDVLSKAHLDSLVCLTPRRVSLDAIDPSLALAFYCSHRDDFADLVRRVRGLAELSQPPLFDVVKVRSPRDGSSALDALFDENSGDAFDFPNAASNSTDLVDDEDDYVVV